MGTPPLNDTVGELNSVDLGEENGIGWLELSYTSDLRTHLVDSSA
jgi:hypothetical protein